MIKDIPKVHNIKMDTYFKLIYFIDRSNNRLAGMSRVKVDILKKHVKVAQRIIGQDAVKPSDYAKLLNEVNKTIEEDGEFQRFVKRRR